MSKQIDNIPPTTLKGRGFNVARIGELIGKLLTVKFQGFTTEGLPRFGVGLTIRNYE